MNHNEDFRFEYRNVLIDDDEVTDEKLVCQLLIIDDSINSTRKSTTCVYKHSFDDVKLFATSSNSNYRFQSRKFLQRTNIEFVYL